jgi:hypothetical protein
VQLKLARLLSWVLLCVPAAAHADEASGTWTGALEGRGNYYWERSTRVVVPEGRVDLAAPNGVRMHAEYLVDVISSASIGQGVTEDGVLTELRHGVGLGVGKELEIADGTQLDLGARGVYSFENDYTSWIYGVDGALSLDERTTKLTLGLTAVNDKIEANNDPTFEGQLDGLTVSLGVERVVNRTITVSAGYQVAHLSGFLGNPYRRVVFENGAPLRESPPDERTRHNFSGRVAFFIPATDTALHLGHRAYIDSGNIAALTPELRVCQQIGDTVLSASYRLYLQTRASFAQESGRYPGSSDGGLDVETTNDPKLLAMRSHTLGLMLEHELGFLESTVLDFARHATIDLRFDRYWSNSSFGNGILATAGGRIPF